MINVPVSYGELLDKLTILELKLEYITDASKLENVRREYAILSDLERELLQKEPLNDPTNSKVIELVQLRYKLRTVNQHIWKIEDSIRDCERRRNFSAMFIELARSVYLNNDERSRIKKEINTILGSDIVEEKSYTSYT